MGRVAIATALGGLVLFAWGAIFWTSLPLAGQVLRPMPADDQVIDSFKQHLREPGVYLFPAHPQPLPNPDGSLPVPGRVKEWEERHRQGPVGIVFYRTEGMQPMSPHQLILGLTLDLAIAFLASLLVYSAGLKGFVGRVGFVFALGLFASLTTHLKHANWLYLPWDYTQLLCADLLAGSLILAIVVAAIVRPEPDPPPRQAV